MLCSVCCCMGIGTCGPEAGGRSMSVYASLGGAAVEGQRALAHGRRGGMAAHTNQVHPPPVALCPLVRARVCLLAHAGCCRTPPRPSCALSCAPAASAPRPPTSATAASARHPSLAPTTSAAPPGCCDDDDDDDLRLKLPIYPGGLARPAQARAALAPAQPWGVHVVRRTHTNGLMLLRWSPPPRTRAHVP